MSSEYQLYLNTKRAKRFDGRHPWVLQHSVIEPTAQPAPGSVVDLLHPSGNWIGRGIYNPNSRIRIRLYQWNQALQLDSDWIRGQLDLAIGMRKAWFESQQSLDAVRWVNSEGDGLSGLVVDQFGPYLVVHITSLAMIGWLDTIRGWLSENLQPAGIYLRVDANTASHEGTEPRDEWIEGSSPSEPITMVENGIELKFDLSKGQKTGYYLDQRANRLAATRWIGKGSLLDVCCYQGGFSLAARKLANSERIEAVDSSLPALEQAEQNALANGFEDIDFVQADCFDYMEHLVAERKRFQTVILDPPRMASNRQQVSAALRAYHRLNLAAVRVLEPQGILVTCSCSGRIKRSDFVGMLSAVAKRAHRRIQILESRGADIDHPIDVNCPESEYLKCLICRVI